MGKKKKRWAKGMKRHFTGDAIWIENNHIGTSLVVQWVRLCATNAWGPGSIPGL